MDKHKYLVKCLICKENLNTVILVCKPISSRFLCNSPFQYLLYSGIIRYPQIRGGIRKTLLLFLLKNMLWVLIRSASPTMFDWKKGPYRELWAYAAVSSQWDNKMEEFSNKQAIYCWPGIFKRFGIRSCRSQKPTGVKFFVDETDKSELQPPSTFPYKTTFRWQTRHSKSIMKRTWHSLPGSHPNKINWVRKCFQTGVKTDKLPPYHNSLRCYLLPTTVTHPLPLLTVFVGGGGILFLCCLSIHLSVHFVFVSATYLAKWFQESFHILSKCWKG